jgi:molybdopterin molybdotransferase
VPEGADTVLIQENTERLEDGLVLVTQAPEAGRNIRPAGVDFTEGRTGLARGRLLDAGAITLAAAMNHAELPVIRKPRVAILATGDELRLPGQTLGPGQIIASNTFGIAALARGAGATSSILASPPTGWTRSTRRWIRRWRTRSTCW